MLCTKEDAAVLDEFIKWKALDLMKGNPVELGQRWIGLMEMTKCELYSVFEGFLKVTTDGTDTSSESNSMTRWNLLFQDNAFIGVLQEGLLKLCTVDPDHLKRMFKNGFEICFFHTLYLGKTKYAFAILGIIHISKP